MSKKSTKSKDNKIFNIDVEARKHYPNSYPPFNSAHHVPVFNTIKHHSTVGSRGYTTYRVA